FDEPVTGFTIDDIDVGNGVAGNFNIVSTTVYTATITPTVDGGVNVIIPPDVAQDLVGNDNDPSNEFFVEYDATRPTLTITSPAPDPTNMDFTVTFTFSEPVLNFEMADLVVTNGTPSAFTVIDSQTYTALITPAALGVVIVDVPADVAQDPATNGNEAAQFSIEYDNLPPDKPLVTDVSEYSCYGNFAMTSDNTLKILGQAESGATVEVFLDGTSIGTVVAFGSGHYVFDYTSTTLADGTYSFTVTATDIAMNTSELSDALTITINTVDTDGDGIADFCDDDVDGNGVTDTDEDCDGDGIIDSMDSDNSSCVSPIETTKSYGFSPNGDGVNDGWFIEGITAFPNSVVQVFSRSGKLVFKKKGYQNDWTGISNQISNNGLNSRLPVGPYLFLIDLGNGTKPVRGWLYINY
ncbi:MAG: gliding motility-associated C-terminal domain-containing protein, partial [Flavobacteriaceae bacterium]